MDCQARGISPITKTNNEGGGPRASETARADVKPHRVSAVMFDWDGTAQRSYKTLEAVSHMHKTLEKYMSSEKADTFLRDLVKENGFQRVLHGQSSTITFFQSFATQHGLHRDRPSVLRETIEVAQEIQREAFVVYNGFKPLLEQLRQADIPAYIYTNSATPDLFKRMNVSNIDPTFFDAIYAKNDPKRPPLKVVMADSPFAMAFEARSISYSPYLKPDPQPIHDVIAATGVDPRHIMFVGEGAKDLDVIHRAALDKRKMGLFAFQKVGAEHCDRIREINEALRPGSEPLGVMQVLKSLAAKQIPSTRVIHMNEGFPTLQRQIASGEIELVPPPRRAIVRDGQLVSDKPAAGPS